MQSICVHGPVCTHICGQVYRRWCRHMYHNVEVCMKSIGMCIDICYSSIGMCMDMCIDMCSDMCMDMRMDL